MSENKELLCPTCLYSIRCNTWAEYKCTLKEKRIYGYKTMRACGSYRKRPKDLEWRPCRCEDCLKVAVEVEE